MSKIFETALGQLQREHFEPNLLKQFRASALFLAVYSANQREFERSWAANPLPILQHEHPEGQAGKAAAIKHTKPTKRTALHMMLKGETLVN